jgi:hypothetical protein
MLAAWELAITLTRVTEDNLIAAFRAVPRTDPYYGYLAANALQVLAAWRPSLLDVPVFLRRMADPQALHADLRQLPFSSRFTPVVTERLPRPRQKAFTTYQPMSYYDILTSSAIQEILEWLTIEHSNMAALDRFGPDVRRVPYALSSLGFGQALSPMTSSLLDKTNSFLRPVTLFGIVVLFLKVFLQCPWTLMLLSVLSAPTFRPLIYNVL